ncbi:alpha/beta hydrolase [Leucobacter allii]|uniref:Alpha/beta hydrolase n=1 Tax=Leucobacter allii TaxID=2932247 RepID=A0ABY4FH99_9MICO|nr:alpha/beta hydrolase [Leucobacter allii]UOQ55873.1 alpha/beta hydrolase [Leucobacter allii]
MPEPTADAAELRRRLLRGAASREIAALGTGARTRFALRGRDWGVLLEASAEGVRGRAEDSDVAPEFALTGDDETWSALLAERPAAGTHSVVHLVRTGAIAVSGATIAYERNVHLVRALIDAARGARVRSDVGRPLAAVGRYHRITTSLGTSDVYVERAGSGAPLLAFATAGSETSQWHGVMTHTDLTDRCELITVDLPWHGKSSPAWDAPVGSYRLTPESYTEFIVAVSDVLGLRRPTLLGVSMGGAAVVHAIATHPERFAGAVSCQAGPSVTARANEHLRGTRVNPALFIPEWTYGLMNPSSPEPFKQRVWWGYSSGGFGLYAADIDSYLAWNLADVELGLSQGSPHIAVLSGAYDTSVPTARSRELAARIPNGSFAEMPELGHFPHAEHPEAFVRHLHAALDRVAAGDPA